MAVQDITLLDDEEKKHAEEIAKNITAATGDTVTMSQLVPAFNQHPLPQFAQTQPDPQDAQSSDQSDDTHIAKAESEVIDVLKGWSGKPRTAPASDFLKSKMKWLSKKNKGADVTLK
jgi:hypothetical protein